MKSERTFQDIANEIELVWPGPVRGLESAALYLDMLQLFDTTDPNAIHNGQRAKDIVEAFLKTSAIFVGLNSFRLKTELRDNAGLDFIISTTYKL